MPYWAIFTTDLSGLVRGWVLRAWLVLSGLLALVVLLDHSSLTPAGHPPANGVITALLHPVDTSAGAAHTLGELLKSYVIIWTTFVVVLTGGAITSELPTVADAVLSRGISRWQYFFGKWTARLVAVLGVYLLVVIPTSALIWLNAGRASVSGDVAPADPTASIELASAPAELRPLGSLDFAGCGFAVVEVAALLSLVVTCGVAFSASFEGTMLSIAVAWVVVYGTGLSLSLLGLARVSPAAFLDRLPALLGGDFAASVQCWNLGAIIGLTLSIAALSSVQFARRDV